MSDKTCTIAIAVLDNKDITRQCLDSLILNTEGPYRVLVIDNGSQDETRIFLENFCAVRENFTLKRFNENTGYLAAANYALSTLKTPYICLLNNDTMVTAGWLSECVSILEARSDIGIISPTTNEISKRFEKLYWSGGIKHYRGRAIEVNSCVGSCFIVKREVVDKIGIFDPIYTDGYFEEVDYCLRAGKAGIRAMMALGAYIHHLGKRSFKKLPEETRYALWHKNRAILESRWGKNRHILFFIKGNYDNGALSRTREYLLDKCRDRAIIDLYFRGNRRWIRGTHFNIRYRDSLFYNFLYLFFILKFKKKSYDAVITDVKIPSFLFNSMKAKISEFIPAG